MQFSPSRDWNAYYNAVQDRPPRPTLISALSRFEAEPMASRLAVDLGCGDGRDTVELLQRGWRVLAIDGEPQGIKRLCDRPNLPVDRLTTRVERFEDLTLPMEVDLINASFCLPFCPPNEFPRFWQKLTAALRVGGRISDQLFGDRDSWATSPNLSCFSREQVEDLLQPYGIEMLEEEEHPGKTAVGDEKYWHIFHLVIRKRNKV
ncbi:MAG: class I SAM-dependent methyltransferase [Oculatellaceae cyanobacterium Prado106]|jgi:SAM-dependent methyltransferase|nr:class I SAM-dependent methyltransferase [Oculatellaceae cyanobacterium Prado106]